MKKQLKLSNYEKILFAIIENSLQKIIASIELYITKYAYPSSYFLAVISQEELAKLIMIPIARELNELEDLLRNKNSPYFKHPIKQEIFTSYGLQNRLSADIETLKQKCLYVGVDEKMNPVYSRITPRENYQEIKYAVILFTDFIFRTILKNKDFSDDFKKCVFFKLKMLKSFLDDKLPSLRKNIFEESAKESKKLRKDKQKHEERFHKELFANPYELVRIFKAIFGKDYKLKLQDIKSMSFDEMVRYLGKNL